MSTTKLHSLFGTVPTYLNETKIFYDCAGLEMKRKKDIIYLFRKLLFFYSCFVHTTLIAIYIRSSIMEQKINEATKALDYDIHFISGLVISLQWIIYRDDMIKYMENVDVNVPDFGDDNVKIREMIEKGNKLNRRMSFTTCSGGVITVVSSLIGWMLFCLFGNNVYEENIDEFNNTIKMYSPDLPSPVYIPFEFRTDLGTYFSVGAFTCVSSIIMVFLIQGNNTLLCSQISFSCLHLNILKFMFQTIRQRSKENLNKADQENSILVNFEMEKEMKRCAIYLESILELCAFTEKRYKLIILFELLASVGFIALSLMMLLTTPVTDSMYVSHIFLMVSSLTLIFIYCYFGNEVTATAAEIPSALYESEWIGCSQSLKTSTLIIMARMRKPVHLTIAGISPVTLDTFLQICRLGYSVVAVLTRTQ